MISDFTLNLDVSTKCTGYSIFDISTRKLVDYGIFRAKVKGLTKKEYPEKPLLVMKEMTEEIMRFIYTFKMLPKVIVVEEIAGSKNRIGQKTLDGMHWILMDRFLQESLISRVVYYDVTGADGWRTHLDLRLSEADKKNNKEAKKLNATLRDTQKLPVVNTKTLSCRYANRVHGLNLNADLDPFDGDRADAICMGDAFLREVEHGLG